MKNTPDIDVTGLHAPRFAVDLQFGRFHDAAGDAVLLEEARQLEAVTARLVAQR